MFIYCLIKANWKDGSWHGYEYKRGQFIASFPSIAKELGITTQCVRKAISNLEKTGEITHSGMSKCSIITVLNYDLYQSKNVDKTHKKTSTELSENNRYKKDTLQVSKEVKKEATHPSDEKPKSKCKDWNEDWKYTDSRGNVYDWGYMVRNFGNNAENMARIIVDEDRKSRS